MIKIYPITPVSKPRMTQSDKWKKRDCVQKYWAFKDAVRRHRVDLPDSGAHVIFHIPMPKSWSKKKREQMNGQPHRQKPDFDNLAKALSDAIFDSDAHIWDMRITKLWSYTGKIEIRISDSNISSNLQ